MKEIERIVSFRKVFLFLSNNFVKVLICALVIIGVLTSSYCLKTYKSSKAFVSVCNNYEVKLKDHEEAIKNIKVEIEQLNLEKSRLLNEIDYNGVARAVLTYSISTVNDFKNHEELDSFYKSVNNALNNGNIARKLKIANRSNNLFSIDLGNALDFDSSVLLIISITAKTNDILSSMNQEIEILVQKEFSSFKLSLKSIEAHEINADLLYNLKEDLNELELRISKAEKSLEKLENTPIIKPVAPANIFSPIGLIKNIILGLVISLIIMVFYILCKIAFSANINDINFAPKYLGIHNLAVLDSERIKKNCLTKLFMRKATYSNKDAYGIVSIYLKEKENLSVLSFLDSEKENEFKKETGANVVNCNGDLSELFKVIADKNNFVILIDTETTKTKQVIEVYNFVKNLGLEMYGAVVYTI